MTKSSEQQVIPGTLDRVMMTPTAVRLVRARLGLRRKELAMVVGVRPATISRWERRTGCGGPARALLRLLGRKPGILRLLGLNYPGAVPDLEVGDGGEDNSEVSEVQSGDQD